MKLINSNKIGLIFHGTKRGKDVFLSINVGNTLTELSDKRSGAHVTDVREENYPYSDFESYYIIEAKDEVHVISLIKSISDFLGRPGYLAVAIVLSKKYKLDAKKISEVLQKLLSIYQDNYFEESNNPIKIDTQKQENPALFENALHEYSLFLTPINNNSLRHSNFKKENSALLVFKNEDELLPLLNHYNRKEIANYEKVFFMPESNIKLLTNKDAITFPPIRKDIKLSITVAEDNGGLYDVTITISDEEDRRLDNRKCNLKEDFLLQSENYKLRIKAEKTGFNTYQETITIDNSVRNKYDLESTCFHKLDIKLKAIHRTQELPEREKERIERERIEKERIEKERIEREKVEREKVERERIKKDKKFLKRVRYSIAAGFTAIIGCLIYFFIIIPNENESKEKELLNKYLKDDTLINSFPRFNLTIDKLVTNSFNLNKFKKKHENEFKILSNQKHFIDSVQFCINELDKKRTEELKKEIDKYIKKLEPFKETRYTSVIKINDAQKELENYNEKFEATVNLLDKIDKSEEEIKIIDEFKRIYQTIGQNLKNQENQLNKKEAIDNLRKAIEKKKKEEMENENKTKYNAKRIIKILNTNAKDDYFNTYYPKILREQIKNNRSERNELIIWLEANKNKGISNRCLNILKN
jgi:hypothetical protein